MIFGVTGDLAHKLIFPALFAMVKKGALKILVIGVAFPRWSMVRLRKRGTDSIERSGGIDYKRALEQLLSLLKYVRGDYNAAGTFTAIKKALGNARRPAHYLAIPPSLFETVIKGLSREFTFAIRRRNIEAELPSESLGTRNPADTAMLVPLTVDFHLTTLHSIEDAAIAESMVLCGVCVSC